MTNISRILLSVLSASPAPALKGLTVPLYLRELQARRLPDGTVSLVVDKLGFSRYKRHRKATTRSPLPVDTAAITAALNADMPPELLVLSTVDCATYVTITVREVGPC